MSDKNKPVDPTTPSVRPHEPPDAPPAEPDTLKVEPTKAPSEKKPAHAPKGIVRSVGHLDDTTNGGKYYRPGDVIEGWDQATIDRMVDQGIATVEGA